MSALGSQVRPACPRWQVLVLLLLPLLLLATVPTPAAPRESRIIVCVLHDPANAAHRSFVEALRRKFNQLGFADRMKKRGVTWLEAGFQGAGSIPQHLRITREQLIYFGVLMADPSEHVTREMFRAHLPISSTMAPKAIKREADDNAHRFYFEVANLLDNLETASLWKRQLCLLNPREERAGGVRILLGEKDLTADTTLFQRPPFMRARIHVVMVPFSAAAWKRLGADEATITSAGGQRSVLTIKKGSRRVVFEVGPELADFKTWSVSRAGHADKRFINPINLLFAYPEMQGTTWFVPLRLVLQELNLPLAYKAEGFTVTLTPKK